MIEVRAEILVTDEMLVNQARGGDLAAREELFRRHTGVAYRVAHRLLSNDQDALDAVQDAYIKALNHLRHFDGRSGFRTWLIKIVTNAARDLGRKRRRRPTIPIGKAEPVGDELATFADPTLGLHREDLRRVLNGALDRLNPPIRETFILFAEAEMSYKEIAAVQDVPLGTVMSRLHHARQKLQSFLEGVDLVS